MIMLEQVLDTIHNYFVRSALRGTITIKDGHVDGLTLLSGQYYRIIGSVLNDGIHTDTDVLADEPPFRGEVWAMAVPTAVIALTSEIEEWQGKYGEAVNTPYQSESFGGYSYSKMSGENGAAVDWRNVFKSRLDAYRKINNDICV